VAGFAAGLTEVQEVDPEAFAWWTNQLENPSDSAIIDIRWMVQSLLHSLRSVASYVKAINASKTPLAPGLVRENVMDIPLDLAALIPMVKDGRTKKLQHTLLNVCNHAQWVKLFDSMPLCFRAAMRARSGSNAHNFLNALPSHPQLFATAPELAFAVRSVLFLPQFDFVIPETWVPDEVALGENFLRFRHVLRTADHSTTHSAMVSTLRLMLASVGVVIYPEPQYTHLANGGSGKRADFLERVLALDSYKHTAYDFTMSSVDAKEHVAMAAAHAGAVPAAIEKRKQKENEKFCEKEGWLFTPLGMDDAGGFGSGMKFLIHQCSSRVDDYPESVPMVENWATPNFTAFWSQALRWRAMKEHLKRLKRKLEELVSKKI
jgi:hypothetical protein